MMFDHRRLSDMNLPKENFLQLLTPEVDEAGSASTSNGESGVAEESAVDFRLNITDESTGRTYNLNFRRENFTNSHRYLVPIKLQLIILWQQRLVCNRMDHPAYVLKKPIARTL